jgi:hypothetical protein
LYSITYGTKDGQQYTKSRLRGKGMFNYNDTKKSYMNGHMTLIPSDQDAEQEKIDL